MKQLALPFCRHPSVTPAQAALAIRSCIESGGAELKDDPVWDWVENHWRGLVAVTPWGPLVIMAFTLKSDYA